jgi:hypothetical protein
MKKIVSAFVLLFLMQIGYSQVTMQATIKPGIGPKSVDIYIKPSASFSQKDENIIFALAIPAIISPAPSGSSGTIRNGLGPVTGILGIQPDFLINNIGTTDLSVQVTAEQINGIPHYIYTFIFAGTAPASHDWTADVEQQIASIAFEGCNSNCITSMKLVSLANGGINGQASWYFQSNTIGDITNYPAPFYANPLSTSPVNGGSPDGSVLSVIELSGPINLPVKLLSFKADPGDCDVTLSWQATQETNFAYFAIERSEGTLAFREIGRVNASGSGALIKSYNFTDDSSPAGTILYRLRMADQNGNYTYGNNLMVGLNCPGKNNILVYPTLSSGEVNVKLPPGYEKARIRIINVLGAEVASNESVSLNRTISLKKLSNGTYMVLVSHNNRELNNVKVVLHH